MHLKLFLGQAFGALLQFLEKYSYQTQTKWMYLPNQEKKKFTHNKFFLSKLWKCPPPKMPWGPECKAVTNFRPKTELKNNFFCMKGKIFILSVNILSLIYQKNWKKIFQQMLFFGPWVQKFLQIPKKNPKILPNFFTFWPKYHDYVMEKIGPYIPRGLLCLISRQKTFEGLQKFFHVFSRF